MRIFFHNKQIDPQDQAQEGQEQEHCPQHQPQTNGCQQFQLQDMKVRIRIGEHVEYKNLCFSKANVALTYLFPGDNCIAWLHKAIVGAWFAYFPSKI